MKEEQDEEEAEEDQDHRLGSKLAARRYWKVRLNAEDMLSDSFSSSSSVYILQITCYLVTLISVRAAWDHFRY